jgi:PAS domain S-box-containing protein
LIVDDEDGIRLTMGMLLKKEGYQVDEAAGHADAMASVQSVQCDIAIVDIMLAGDNGIDLLQDIKTSSPATHVIIMTGFPEAESAAAALRLGAFDYITKPLRYETLSAVVRHALSDKAMREDRKRYQANLDAIFRTVSDSIIMVDKAGRLAQFNATAEKVCGYRDDQIGVAASVIRLGCNGSCRTTLLETLLSNLPRELRRFECKTPHGKNRIVSINATPVMETDGTIGGAVAVIRDETYIVDMERSLQKRGRFSGIIGASSPMQRVYSLIEALAEVPTTVLINGESGTGKELVAAALHTSGARSKGPFVKVNCSALSESLLESELFGHVRGAFTGAISDKVGRFQKAHRGTLFLDEIGDISSTIQMRLLRVLQESEFERVGESTPIKVDVRIVAATNQNLAEKVSQGIFRQDLYYRLNVVQLVLPTLAERIDDLDLLLGHFISKFNDKLSKNIDSVSDDVRELLNRHDWPGNVRELEHIVEHACLFCKSGCIALQDLPHDFLDAVNYDKTKSEQTQAGNISLDDALKICSGNKTRAAELLGISRRTLYRHLEEGAQL